MTDKALISEYTWRSLESQKADFPDMPHFVIPDDLSVLFRQSMRKKTDTFHVSSLGIIADNEKAFRKFMENAVDSFIESKEGHTINPKSNIENAVALWRSARVMSAAKIGAKKSADGKKAKSAEGVELIRADWPKPSSDFSTAELKERSGLSLNTIKKHLGSRVIAQYNYKGKNNRQIKALELEKSPREKLDFCGVYVFQIDDDAFKIGSSKNSGMRLKQVSAYHKKRMKVAALFNMEIEKAQALETEVHYRLRKHLHPDYNGREIFKTSLAAINRTVKQAKKYLFEVPNE